jgi:hypothetical protein
MSPDTITTIREASEEIASVEAILEQIGETGNDRADGLLQIASASLRLANWRILAVIIQADMNPKESANLPNPKKCSFGNFMN